MLYERIFKEFQKVRLNYVVIGGIAVNLHGYPRATGDLDIIILLQNEDLTKFIQAIKNLKFVPRVPVDLNDLTNEKIREGWIQEKNMKVFSVYNPGNPLEHIDLKIEGAEKFAQILKNRVTMKESDLEIPVASLDDLIALKQDAGRERDLVDIKILKQIKKLKDDGTI